MLYLYTIMMFAWDLDPDTHLHFRRFLDIFIEKRKISKVIKEIVGDPQRRRVAKIHPSEYRYGKFNELRVGLPTSILGGGDAGDGIFVQRRVRRVGVGEGRRWFCGLRGSIHMSIPKLIEDIHPPKYHHNARKLSAPSRPHTNP